MLIYTEQSSIYIQQILPAPSHPQPRKRGIEDGASARPWSYDLRLTGFSECTIHNSYGQAVPAFGRLVLRFVTVRSVTIKVLSPRRVTSARAFCVFLFCRPSLSPAPGGLAFVRVRSCRTDFLAVTRVFPITAHLLHRPYDSPRHAWAFLHQNPACLATHSSRVAQILKLA